MTRKRLHAVLPVKRLDQAKSRLASVLSGPERNALAEAMMLDVLDALTGCRHIDGVVVVTSDETAARHARAHGADVLARRDDRGYSDAANTAVEAFGDAAGSLLVVPADIPLVRPGDLARIVLENSGVPGVTIVPAAVDGGTNAILVAPPDAVTFRFGLGSCARHAEAARHAGFEPRLFDIARIAHDIDRPEDLARFMHTPSPTRTYRLLDRLGGRWRFAAPPKREPTAAHGHQPQTGEL